MQAALQSSLNFASMDSLLPPTTSIPLHCNVCPKKPDFSDVSHLLTHIASKGHLSHYYKMKVKASTEAASKRIVDEYDNWYEEWNVEELMMERMNQKERKKGNSKANGDTNGASNSRRGSAANSAASSRSTPVATSLANRRSQALRETMLDPQLGPRIKTEPKSRSTTPASSFALDAAALHRSYAPPMQSWPDTPYAISPVRQQGSIFESMYRSPSSESADVDLQGQAIGHALNRNLSGSTQSTQSLALDEMEFDDGLGEDSKLKGVIWEGMGLFDSATPDMRRKRNQKKANSVVEFLQATSEVVEATELVFDAEGVLRRERPITGNPESDDGGSPLPGESTPEPDIPAPKKKKTGRRSRQALTEKDVNTGRVLRRRGDSHHPSSKKDNRRAPYFDGADDEDDDLTYGRSRPKRRGGLSIHRDNSGPDITFDHPAPLTTLTSSFRNPFQSASDQGQRQDHSTYQNGFARRPHQRQPSLPFRSGFRPVNNNNFGMLPPNFGSFGQLNGQSMFQNASLHNNPFPPINGHQTVAAFQQQFSVPQQPFMNSNDIFQSQNVNHNQVQNNGPWDVFGFGQPDMNMQSNGEVSFHAVADFSTVNPLFFSSNQVCPDDDEATVSPPESQHERGG